MTSSTLRKTALHAVHKQLGARMAEFAGWEMPIQYAGPLSEHLAVRTRAGVFDVSHMGEIEIRGDAAEANLQKVTCNDTSRLAVGQCQYSALTTPRGTFVDDILVYRLSADHFLLCVNASNQEKDYCWIRDHIAGVTEVNLRSDDYTQLAVQGPASHTVLQRLTPIRLSELKYYRFAKGPVAGAEAIISRTGYTGEDGFELYFGPRHSERVWSSILEAGRDVGLQPAGLAARNTLRLEAKFALYGNDIDETTTVLEADLGWIARLGKGDFIGRDALIRQQQEGLARKLVGFEMVGRGIARDHYPVQIDGENVGVVASGSHAPSLNRNIGLTYLPLQHCVPGTAFEVVIRGRPVKAKVVSTPFYRRPAA